MHFHHEPISSVGPVCLLEQIGFGACFIFPDGLDVFQIAVCTPYCKEISLAKENYSGCRSADELLRWSICNQPEIAEAAPTANGATATFRLQFSRQNNKHLGSSMTLANQWLVYDKLPLMKQNDQLLQHWSLAPGENTIHYHRPFLLESKPGIKQSYTL